MAPDLQFLPIVTTVVFLILAAFIVGFTLLFQRRQLENLREKQMLQSQYEHATLESQIEIQNQTLQTVGQDLHDNVGQILTVARLYLNTLEEDNKQLQLQSAIEQSNRLVEQAIQSLRDLSKSLDGFAVRDFGLIQGISHELRRLEQTKKFSTGITVQGEPVSGGYNVDIILFRIVQETLNNAIKHARATNIMVSIRYNETGFVIDIKDNGIGFDYDQTTNRKLEQTGTGLRNMQRRATLIGCTCTFNSQQGKGTTVQIEKKIATPAS